MAAPRCSAEQLIAVVWLMDLQAVLRARGPKGIPCLVPEACIPRSSTTMPAPLGQQLQQYLQYKERIPSQLAAACQHARCLCGSSGSTTKVVRPGVADHHERAGARRH